MLVKDLNMPELLPNWTSKEILFPGIWKYKGVLKNLNIIEDVENLINNADNSANKKTTAAAGNNKQVKISDQILNLAKENLKGAEFNEQQQKDFVKAVTDGINNFIQTLNECPLIENIIKLKLYYEEKITEHDIYLFALYDQTEKTDEDLKTDLQKEFKNKSK